MYATRRFGGICGDKNFCDASFAPCAVSAKKLDLARGTVHSGVGSADRVAYYCRAKNVEVFERV